MSLDANVIQAIGWSLVHVLWQVTLVALALGAALALLKDRSPNVRYAVSCGALLLAVVLPFATALSSYDPLPKPQTVAVSAPREIFEINGVAIQASVRDTIVAAAPKLFNWRESLQSARTSLQPMLPWIVRLWCLGVILFSVRLVIGLLQARRVVARGTTPASDDWQRIALRLADRMNIRRGVKLLESAIVEVPTVVGWVRPAILIPVSAFTGLSAEQLETILAHELAHIRRHDFLINVLQSVVETLLFYHPAIWWISGQVRVERENCCDDLAVDLCGDPVIYAHALTTLERLRSEVPQLAVAATGGSLLSRIRRLVGVKTATSRSEAWFAGASFGAFVLILLIALPLRTLALQVADDPKPEPKKSGTSVTVEAPEAEEQDPEDELAELDVDFDYDVDYDYDHDADMDVDVDVDIDSEEIAAAVEAATAIAAIAPRVEMAIAPTVAVAPQIAQAVADGVAGAIAPPGDSEWEFDFDFDHDQDTPAPPGRKRIAIDKNRLADFTNLSVDDLIHLRNIGVDAAYVRELQSVGLAKLTYGELISLRAMGVDASFVKAMRAAFGNDVAVRDLVRLKAVGVDPEFIREMKDAGVKELTIKELTRLRAVGVDGKTIRELRGVWPSVTIEQVVSLRSVGVDDEYLRGMKAAGYGNLEPRDAVKLRALGVDPEYVRGMNEAGFRNLSIAQITKLRAVGVEPDYMKRLAAEGFTNLTIDDLIRLKTAGVDEEFIREMKSLGKKP